MSAYRLPDQVEGADDPVGTFMFTIPGPHRRLEHASICWKSSGVEHRQSRRLLECTDDNSLAQAIEELK